MIDYLIILIEHSMSQFNPANLYNININQSIHILFKELVLVEPTTPSILRKIHGKYTKKRVRIAELPEMRKTRKHL